MFAAGTDATTYTVTVSGTQTAGGVSFEEGTVLITAGTLSLTGTGTYNVASGLVGTVGSTVTGTIGYAKTGTGRVALTSTASTITGPVSVTGGILEIISSGAIGGTGVGAGNITLNGGTFRNAATGAGITFLTANRGFVIGASGGTIDVPGTSANIQIYTSGNITGVGNTLTKSGPGVLRNTTPTSITFSKLNVTGGLYQGAADTVFGAVPGSYLADAITLNGGGISVNAGVTFSVNRGITLGASGGSIDGTSAPVVPSKITGVGALTKTGSGILTLSGANDFSGGVNQTTSRINYNNSSAAGTGTINVAAAATEFVCSSGTSTLTNSIVLASGANPRYYATSGNGIDQTGIISGTGALTRDDTGAGNVTLSGSNTFSGGIAWTSRSLRINNKNALGNGLFGIGGVAAPTTPPLTLTAVSTLSGSDSLTNAVAINQDFTFAAVSSAQFNGPVIMPATRVITINSGVTLTLSGVISNSTAGLNKAGLGTLSLGGANLYTGATALNAGTLLVNGSLNAASAVTVASAATLGGNGTINGTVTVNAGGTVAPGTSIGTLTLASAPSLGGTIVAEIDRNGGSPLADKINCTGGATFGGALTVQNVGLPAQNGDTFDLFDGAVGGTFSTISLPPGGLLHWKTNNLTVNGTITFTNLNPVAANFSVGVAVGGSTLARVIGKYAQTNDADGDAVTITAVSTPASGTATIVGGTNITYTSTGGPGSDSFTYTVSDGVGGTDTKTVSVTISSPEGFNKLSGPTGAGPYSFSYLGIPGLNYSLDESPNLVAPYTWFPVITNTASGTGAIDYIGVTLSYPSGSFRTRHIP